MLFDSYYQEAEALSVSCEDVWCWVQFLSPIFRETAVGFAALAGVVIAWRGLNTWRRELRGQEDYALARRILRAALEVRDVIKSARFAGYTAEEQKAAIEAIRAESKEPDFDGIEEEVFWRRQGAVRSAMSALEAEATEGEALWGIGTVASRPLADCAGELEGAINRFVRYGKRPRPGDDPRFFEDAAAIVWNLKTPDEFGARLGEALQTLEGAIRPRLGSRHPGRGRIRRLLGRS